MELWLTMCMYMCLCAVYGTVVDHNVFMRMYVYVRICVCVHVWNWLTICMYMCLCAWLTMCMYMCLCAVYGMKALTAHTFVDDVFGGTLVSTVKCTECANVSSTAEHSPLC